MSKTRLASALGAASAAVPPRASIALTVCTSVLIPLESMNSSPDRSNTTCAGSDFSSCAVRRFSSPTERMSTSPTSATTITPSVGP